MIGNGYAAERQPKNAIRCSFTTLWFSEYFMNNSKNIIVDRSRRGDGCRSVERYGTGARSNIAPVKRAERLLTDFAETSGRIIEQADDGVFLARPAVDAPIVEEFVAQPVVEEIAQPEPEVVAQPVATGSGVARKYPTLSKTFFNGSPQGQILSVYKDTREQPVDSDAKCNTLGRSGSPRKDRIFLSSPQPSAAFRRCEGGSEERKIE